MATKGSKKDPLMLFREALCAKLGRTFNDPIVVELSHAFGDASLKIETMLVMNVYGSAKIYFEDGIYIETATTSTYARYRKGH